MNQLKRLLLFLIMVGFSFSISSSRAGRPWDHGKLEISENGRFLQHEDGTPFFWQGQTAWLLPERLDRDEAEYFLSKSEADGYNVAQIQVINAIPAFNRYGAMSMPDGFDFSKVDHPGFYGYWDHLDYIIDSAARHGIYIGMVCIWGGMVKSGQMDTEQAQKYGEFLANRYKDRPNIIWFMGGDIQGDIHTEVWDTLAHTIKRIDPNHLMTFHPRGRTTSARWFADRDWIDFHTFQSGHRRYGQRKGDKNYPIPDNTEEDNWMYVDSTWSHQPIKPVLDSEPSYEDIPQGLHDAAEPHWSAKDVRRYAYWSVFAGSCGHTYGHNVIMQFLRPGVEGAYFADGDRKPWWKALDDEGVGQMRHLSELIKRFPYFERIPDQTVVVDNGTRYDRLAATRGNDYILVYNHTGRPMRIDASKISGAKKRVWWMDAATGKFTDLGFEKDEIRYSPVSDADGVLIIFDENKRYIE